MKYTFLSYTRIKEIVKQCASLFRETFKEFIEDNGLKLSASLSYYALFSLPPLVMVIMSVSGYFFGEEAVSGQIFGKINGLVGNEAALGIQEIIRNVKLSDSSTFAATAGVIILLVSASGVFAEIQDSLNFIWGIKAKPKRGIYKFMKNRLMSFSMIGSVGILLLLGLLVNSFLDLLDERLMRNRERETYSLFYMFNMIQVFTSTTVLFAIIFRTLPDGKIVLRDCLIGAAFTSVLFMLGKFAIGAYLGSSAVASVYGAAGSVILMLVWVYYSAIIFYFGAEFTKVFALAHGGKITPNSYSVHVVNREIELPKK